MTDQPARSSRFTALLLVALALTPIGCESYALRGKVVTGDESLVTLVTDDDPRLADPGIANATLRVTLDPHSLGRQVLAESVTRTDGSFAIPINKFGAGTLEYPIELLARRKDHAHAKAVFQLPPRDQRVLVILAPGRDTYRPPDDPLEGARPYLDAP